MLRTVHKYQTLAFFEGLTSSDVLIFIVKVNLSGLYHAVYLSRSIRPNKYPKTECQIWCKARPSPSLSFLLLRGKFKQVYATWHFDAIPAWWPQIHSLIIRVWHDCTIAPHLMAHFEAFKKIIMKVTFFPMHRPPPMLIDLCSKDQCSVSNIPPLLLWLFNAFTNS